MESQKKAYLSASIGNTLEFYDYALFGFYAKYFAKLYFPLENPLNALLLAFTVFAIGFICRPVGGVLFGYLGDRFGRKQTLSCSLIGIGLVTFLMGLLPTYSTWGVVAPLCLAFLRVLQGVCIGGEYSNSLIFVTEHLKKYQAHFPALTTGLISAMGVLGWFFASVLCIYFKEEEWGRWCWRIPFFLGSIVAGFGWYVRKGTENAFEPSKESKIKLKDSFIPILFYKKTALKIFSFAAVMGVLFYGQFIFNNSFIPQVTKLDPLVVNKIISLGLFSYMIFLPLMGYVADRWGYKRSILTASLLTGCLGPALFYLQFSGSVGALILSQVASGMILALLLAPGTYVMGLSFPASIRCLGVSLCYNVGATLFGGLTPDIYLLMYKTFGSTQGMALFFSSIGLLGALVFSQIKFSHLAKGKQSTVEGLFFRLPFWLQSPSQPLSLRSSPLSEKRGFLEERVLGVAQELFSIKMKIP